MIGMGAPDSRLFQHLRYRCVADQDRNAQPTDGLRQIGCRAFLQLRQRGAPD